MKFYKILFSLLLIVTACNFYIFFNRNNYIYIKQSAYIDLYRKTSIPFIYSFVNINDSTLLIKLSNPSPIPITWFVKRNNDEPVTLNLAEPVVSLKQGVSTYTVFSESFPDTITIKVEYYPIDYYHKLGNSQNAGMVIYKSDLPFFDYPFNAEQWDGNKIAVSQDDEAVLATILKDSIQIKQSDNTFEKIGKLGGFLHEKISKSRGTPTDRMIALPVFQQYKAALAGEKIWCGIYAQIFNLFATATHIKSRYIEIKQSYGAVAGSAHVFNEYYLPEQKQWAAIDILFNNLAYIDAAGNFLNAVEVKNTDPGNGSVMVLQSYSKDSIISIPFTRLEPDFFDLYSFTKNLYYYHETNGKRVYSIGEKIKRYCSRASWFENYSDNSLVDNRPFYIKQLFIILELLLLLTFLFSVIANLFVKQMARSALKS